MVNNYVFLLTSATLLHSCAPQFHYDFVKMDFESLPLRNYAIYGSGVGGLCVSNGSLDSFSSIWPEYILFRRNPHILEYHCPVGPRSIIWASYEIVGDTVSVVPISAAYDDTIVSYKDSRIPFDIRKFILVGDSIIDKTPVASSDSVWTGLPQSTRDAFSLKLVRIYGDDKWWHSVPKKY